MNSENVDVSVVIGFRDWGLNRLRLSIQSIFESALSHDVEVIVSDYGSSNAEEVRAVVEASGGIYVFTESYNEPWSRSRSLNAGFAVSRGRVLISTDADMLFSPGALSTIAEMILDDPLLAVVLQCRDLPEGYSDDAVMVRALDWSQFDRVARLRPRWGMGGMMATSRKAYISVRGFDERMHTYGGEDLDFAQRIRRAGNRLMWIDEADVRMYHMWHPKTISSVSATSGGPEAVKFNQSIVRDDKTTIRNVLQWVHRPADAPLLVSVVIVTRNRAGLLRESIASVLCQSVAEFELIVIDDGSEDDTRSVVESFHDERIRYVHRSSQGIPAARNLGAHLARGVFTVVHDDDDIMLPERIERHFLALTEGSAGSYGAYVNFSDETGESAVLATKKFNILTSLATGGAPGHPTWMVKTAVLKGLLYDESARSGSDNNLALRMIKSGLKFDHTGNILTLRRMHKRQVTSTDSENQQTTAKLSLRFLRHLISNEDVESILKDRGASDLVTICDRDGYEEWIRPYLPDHLVERIAVVSDSDGGAFIDHPGVGDETYTICTTSGEVLGRRLEVRQFTWADMVTLRRLGLDASIRARPGGKKGLAEESKPAANVGMSAESLLRTDQDRTGVGSRWVIWGYGGAPEACLPSRDDVLILKRAEAWLGLLPCPESSQTGFDFDALGVASKPDGVRAYVVSDIETADDLVTLVTGEGGIQ